MTKENDSYHEVLDMIQYIEDYLRKNGVIMDVDGVCADTASIAVTSYNNRFNDKKTSNDLKHYWSIRTWVESHGYNSNEAREVSVGLWNTEEVMTKALPVSGSWIINKYLHDKNVPIKYVTSRPFFTKDWTISWFKNWMPWVNEDQIYIGDASNGLQRDYKVQTMGDIGYGVIIEDAGDHAEHIAEVMPDSLVVLVNQPWNRDYVPTNPRIVKPSRRAISQPKLVDSYLALAERIT